MTLGFELRSCVFVTSLSSNGDFGGWKSLGVCSERVEIILNARCGAINVAANMKSYCHFSWQAQYFVRVGGAGVGVQIFVTLGLACEREGLELQNCSAGLLARMGLPA